MSYLAYITFTVRTGPDACDVETREVSTDVTDSITDHGGLTATVKDALLENMYWREVHNLPGLIEVTGGSICREVKNGEEWTRVYIQI
jgi:hypothetical protein